MIDNVARNELEEIMKCTQDISQAIKEKQYHKQELKSNKEQQEKQSQTQSICFEVRATALLPAFTAVKGFHYPPRNFIRSTEDRSTELHHLQSSTEEGSQQERTSSQVITKRITNFSLQLPYRMRRKFLALEV